MVEGSTPNDRLIPLTAQIVASYVGHNTVASADLAALMSSGTAAWTSNTSS